MPENVELPETLHHYTTADGLMGILRPVDFVKARKGFDGTATPFQSHRSFSLWATDARFLNDSAELTFAADAFATELTRRLDTQAYGLAPLDGLKTLIDQLRRRDFTGPWLSYTTVMHAAYVTCFCREGDLLSQWRGYGANGGGYSIEFETSALESLHFALGRHGNNPIAYTIGPSSLRPVTYGLPVREVETAVSHIVQHMERSPFHISKAVEELARFKDLAFEDEDEWRIIRVQETFSTAAEYRTDRSGMLIPYIRMPRPQDQDKPTAIRSITVGPGNNQSLRAESLRQFLIQLTMADVEVKSSSAPYRGM